MYKYLFSWKPNPSSYLFSEDPTTIEKTSHQPELFRTTEEIVLIIRHNSIKVCKIKYEFSSWLRFDFKGTMNLICHLSFQRFVHHLFRLTVSREISNFREFLTSSKAVSMSVPLSISAVRVEIISKEPSSLSLHSSILLIRIEPR